MSPPLYIQYYTDIVKYCQGECIRHSGWYYSRLARRVVFLLRQMEEIGKESALLVIETNFGRDKFFDKSHLTNCR